jgi:rRNA maturation endonuclease Nob1
MSSNSESTTQNSKTVPSELISEGKSPTERIKIREFLMSWKFKVRIVLTT